MNKIGTVGLPRGFGETSVGGLIRGLVAGAATALCLCGPAAAGSFEEGQAAARAGHFATALRLWRPLADDGDSAAAGAISWLYATGGEGVRKDSARASAWAHRAAELGDVGAQTHFGYLYERGDGVPGNYRRAAARYRKAADQGFALAEYDLAGLYTQGHGVARDPVLAAEWCRRAAVHGLAVAQYNLADMYDAGLGVPRDDTLAAGWLRKAADQGNARAQVNLGVFYITGQGVPRDWVRAYMWLDLAATRDEGAEPIDRKDERRQRDALAHHMTQAQTADAKRLERGWAPVPRAPGLMDARERPPPRSTRL